METGFVDVGFSEETCKKLRKPLPRHTRRGPGGTYSYIKGGDVIRTLNDAFQHRWSSEKLDAQQVEDQILMLVSISVVVGGDVITHQGYGSSPIMRTKNDNKIVDIGNTYKSAYTNALKKAAEQFGIGLSVDDEEDGEDEVRTPEERSLPVKSSGRPTAVVPQLSQEQQAKVFSSPNPGPVKGATSKPSGPAGFKPLVQAGNRTVKPNTPPTKSPVQSKFQPPPSPTAQAEAERAFPKLNNGNDRVLLSSQQKTAIERLAELREFNEQDAIKKALPNSTVSTFSELTQEEATRVITFLSGYSG